MGMPACEVRPHNLTQTGALMGTPFDMRRPRRSSTPRATRRRTSLVWCPRVRGAHGPRSVRGASGAGGAGAPGGAGAGPPLRCAPRRSPPGPRMPCALIARSGRAHGTSSTGSDRRARVPDHEPRLAAYRRVTNDACSCARCSVRRARRRPLPPASRLRGSTSCTNFPIRKLHLAGEAGATIRSCAPGCSPSASSPASSPSVARRRRRACLRRLRWSSGRAKGASRRPTHRSGTSSRSPRRRLGVAIAGGTAGKRLDSAAGEPGPLQDAPAAHAGRDAGPAASGAVDDLPRKVSWVARTRRYLRRRWLGHRGARRATRGRP